MIPMRAWLLIALVVLVHGESPAFFCAGDCDGDGEVSVDQVLILVNIALDSTPVSSCTAGDGNGDGEITIDEIIAALGHALTACPGPRVGGAWLENQYRLVSSTCSAAIISALRDAVAARPNCLTQVRVIGPGEVSGTDCNGIMVRGGVDRSGIVTFRLPARSGTQSGCTITETVETRVDLRTMPGLARYDDRFSFAGTCAMSSCSAVIESRWTLQQ
jgi:hypothetical protein